MQGFKVSVRLSRFRILLVQKIGISQRQFSLYRIGAERIVILDAGIGFRRLGIFPGPHGVVAVLVNFLHRVFRHGQEVFINETAARQQETDQQRQDRQFSHSFAPGRTGRQWRRWLRRLQRCSPDDTISHAHHQPRTGLADWYAFRRQF